jgi:hypothetical protein
MNRVTPPCSRWTVYLARSHRIPFTVSPLSAPQLLPTSRAVIVPAARSKDKA